MSASASSSSQAVAVAANDEKSEYITRAQLDECVQQFVKTTAGEFMKIWMEKFETEFPPLACKIVDAAFRKHLDIIGATGDAYVASPHSNCSSCYSCSPWVSNETTAAAAAAADDDEDAIAFSSDRVQAALLKVWNLRVHSNDERSFQMHLTTLVSNGRIGRLHKAAVLSDQNSTIKSRALAASGIAVIEDHKKTNNVILKFQFKSRDEIRDFFMQLTNFDCLVTAKPTKSGVATAQSFRNAGPSQRVSTPPQQQQQQSADGKKGAVAAQYSSYVGTKCTEYRCPSEHCNAAIVIRKRGPDAAPYWVVCMYNLVHAESCPQSKIAPPARLPSLPSLSSSSSKPSETKIPAKKPPDFLFSGARKFRRFCDNSVSSELRSYEAITAVLFRFVQLHPSALCVLQFNPKHEHSDFPTSSTVTWSLDAEYVDILENASCSTLISAQHHFFSCVVVFPWVEILLPVSCRMVSVDAVHTQHRNGYVMLAMITRVASKNVVIAVGLFPAENGENYEVLFEAATKAVPSLKDADMVFIYDRDEGKNDDDDDELELRSADGQEELEQTLDTWFPCNEKVKWMVVIKANIQLNTRKEVTGELEEVVRGYFYADSPEKAARYEKDLKEHYPKVWKYLEENMGDSQWMIFGAKKLRDKAYVAHSANAAIRPLAPLHLVTEIFQQQYRVLSKLQLSIRNEVGQVLGDRCNKVIRRYESEVRRLTVNGPSVNGCYDVRRSSKNGEKFEKFGVNLEKKMCSCDSMMIFGTPCSHFMFVAQQTGCIDQQGTNLSSFFHAMHRVEPVLAAVNEAVGMYRAISIDQIPADDHCCLLPPLSGKKRKNYLLMDLGSDNDDCADKSQQNAAASTSTSASKSRRLARERKE